MEAYQKHLSDFDAYLTLKNFSSTRSTYGCALKQFFAYREKQGMNGSFTPEQAREYILYRHNQGLKWQTINGDYSAMYKFYREVMGLDWDVQHIPRPRKEQSLPPVLSQQEIQKIINHGGTFKHQVFMMLLYSTGLRLSEALNLRLADIDGERLQIRVVKGKSAKDRYVEMPPCLLKLLPGLPSQAVTIQRQASGPSLGAAFGAVVYSLGLADAQSTVRLAEKCWRLARHDGCAAHLGFRFEVPRTCALSGHLRGP